MHETVMEISHLTKKFRTGGFFGGYDYTAVDDVSFSLRKGEILSLIGESGSGKTTIGRMILKLLQPTSGRILFCGRDITKFSKTEKADYYNHVQAVFQEPFSSFNPLYKIDRVFAMIFNRYFPETAIADRKERIDRTLIDVNLEPQSILGKYPHQLSGGQLQRVLIARALLLRTELLVADELISMLDASTRIGVLNLLGRLAKEKGLAVIFITHDLSLGYYISDMSMIMYQGRIVEMGETAKVYHNAVHPYTRLLLRSVPDVGIAWDKDEDFNPDMIESEIQAFYAVNHQKENGILEIEANHHAVLSG